MTTKKNVTNVLNVSEKNVSANLSKETEKMKENLISQTTGYSLNELMQQLNGVGKRSNSVGKKSVYSENIFKDCISDKERKQIRSKLRRMKDNFLTDILRCKDNTHLKSLIKDFDLFYLNCFAVTDYSVNSFTDTKDETKIKNIRRMFEIINANR